MTLLRVISEAAFVSGFDVKTSELHGLSQRGGSVSVSIRFGDKVYSPMVGQNRANLIIALEQQEALSGLYLANKETIFLINEYEVPAIQQVSRSEIESELKRASQNLYFVPASEICQKELNNEVVSGIYLLGEAVKRGFLPLKAEAIDSAIKKIMPEKFWEINLKAFNLPLQFANQ